MDTIYSFRVVSTKPGQDHKGASDRTFVTRPDASQLGNVDRLRVSKRRKAARGARSLTLGRCMIRKVSKVLQRFQELHRFIGERSR